MSNISRKTIDNVHPIASASRRQPVSSYGFDLAQSHGAARPLLGCSRCDAAAVVIDGGISLCGGCYLVESVRRDAVASPSDRLQRAAAALEALRRILEGDGTAPAAAAIAPDAGN